MHGAEANSIAVLLSEMVALAREMVFPFVALRINMRKNMKNIFLFISLVFILLSYHCTIAQVQRDTSDAVWTIVVPQIASVDVDMKQCLVGNMKDSVITAYITNTGVCQDITDTIFIIGKDANQFQIVSGSQQFSLNPGEAQNMEFNFIPTSVGNKTAQMIEIITQSDTLIKNIIGEGIPASITNNRKFNRFWKSGGWNL